MERSDPFSKTVEDCLSYLLGQRSLLTWRAANRTVANIASDASAVPNMEDLIAQALEKQRSVLESVIYSAVRRALAEISASLVPAAHRGRA